MCIINKGRLYFILGILGLVLYKIGYNSGILNKDLSKMNNSVSTMSGKTKLKIVLLGNQSVGKSSIIEKYVKDSFD